MNAANIAATVGRVFTEDAGDLADEIIRRDKASFLPMPIADRIRKYRAWAARDSALTGYWYFVPDSSGEGSYIRMNGASMQSRGSQPEGDVTIIDFPQHLWDVFGSSFTRVNPTRMFLPLEPKTRASKYGVDAIYSNFLTD